jgi:hypothetical protein
MDNSLNNNLYNIDLLMLGNKGKKYNINSTNNNLINNEEIQNVEYILKDFKIYKKQIKTKINNLYTSYLDNSYLDNSYLDNSNNILLNNKINGYFYFFIKSVIDDIKNENIKYSIQNELINYNNKTNTNENYKKDTSYNDLISNSKNKNKNIEQYLDIKKINNIKILPKKRY